MKEIILTVGPPGIGKTTWANQFTAENPSYVAISRDDLRLYLTGTYDPGHKEKEVTEMQEAIAYEAFSWGKGVIIADTNLNPDTVARWREIAAQENVPFRLQHFFGVTLEELLERNRHRDKKVPQKVIQRMYTTWREQYFQECMCEAPPGLPKAAIFDIDGTLAIKGDRSPYDMTLVGEDGVNHPVAGMATILYEQDFIIILLSGRESTADEATREWLHRHSIPFDILHFRAKGDYRKDSIVKFDLYNEKVRPYFDVQWVFDDRDQVVNMWRQIGLPCFQVNYGNF